MSVRLWTELLWVRVQLQSLKALAFCFIVRNLAKKAVLHFLLIILDYIKSTLRKEQLKGKSWKTKNISFQFQYTKFSQQNNSTRSSCYRCVTRGNKGVISPVLSQKLKFFSWFWEKYLECGHLKCIFEVFLGEKLRNFTMQGPFFLCCRCIFVKVP